MGGGERENKKVSLFAAILLGWAQDAADVNTVRPAADLVPDDVDVFIRLPDAPGLRRKLRQEPYKTLMADVAAALQSPIDPSRILGLLGGEIAVIIPDVKKEAVLILVDTGVKNNMYAGLLTRLLPDPWVRKEEEWKEGTVVALSGPATWYVRSVGRYCVMSTQADALKALLHAMGGEAVEKPLSASADYKAAAERLGACDVAAYAPWGRIRKKIDQRSIEGRLAAAIPALWSAAGVTFAPESIEIKAVLFGKELAGLFANAKEMDRPGFVPAGSDAVTIGYPVLDRWGLMLGADPVKEFLDGCQGPLVLFDRYDDPKKGDSWQPLALLSCKDPDRQRELALKLKPETLELAVIGSRAALGTGRAVRAFVEGAQVEPIWQTERFKSIEAAPGCLFDFRTPRALEYLMLLPRQKAAEAKGRGESASYEKTADTLFALAPLTGHLSGSVAIMDARADGLSARIVLRLNPR